MNLLLTTILTAVLFLSYSKVPLLFFQQDELLGLGVFMRVGWDVVFRNTYAAFITHYIPVTMALSYGIFALFGFNPFVYNAVSLVIHMVNIFLVYLLARRMLKSKIAVFISVLVFASSNVAAEILMWPIINLNVISLTFSLLSWLILIDKKMLPKVSGSPRMILVTVLFLLSLFSLEYSAGFAVFIPVAYLLLEKDKLKSKLAALTPLVISLFLYFLFRIIPLTQSGAFAYAGVAEGVPIYLKWVYYIPRYFGQLFIGQPILLSLSTWLAMGNEFRAENQFFPAAAFVLGLIVILVSVYIFKAAKGIASDYSKMFLLVTLSIVVSSLPFLLVPGVAGYFTIFSPRYLYFGLVGLSLYLGFVYDIFLVKKRRFLLFLVLISVIFIIVSGVSENYKKGNALYEIGKTRVEILNFIGSNVSTLQQKAVFYTESNMSYYGLPESEKIMPFQSGFGQTLLIYLSRNKKLPVDFYPGYYLWEIKSQGYEEHGGRGFGYFRDSNLLKDAVFKYKIPPDSISAFSWNGHTGEIEDISDRIRRDVFGAN